MAGRIAVSDDKQFFVRDGDPWFWQADTVWAAFTNASAMAWEQYLRLRARQGFNVLQVNILPQWDRSRGGHEEQEPFNPGPDGGWDYGHPNPGYFDRARAMCAQAVGHGFVLALVVLWCDNVPDTWAAKRELGAVMPPEAVEPYTAFVVDTFKEFEPVWLIAGDTDFPQRGIDYYRRALRTVRQKDPGGLTTLHLGGGRVLHETFTTEEPVDFWMYQSGHSFDPSNAEVSERPFVLGDQFADLSGPRPLLNGEPCYEGIKPAQRRLRVTREDMRRVIWLSLTSGAGAGITYGAHGLWGWHHETDQPLGDGNLALAWSTALRFEGAWDVALAGWLFRQFRLFPLLAAQDLLDEGPQDTRVAATPDRSRVVVYTPSAGEVVLKEAVGDAWMTSVGLEDRCVGRPIARADGAQTVLDLTGSNSDQLVIIEA